MALTSTEQRLKLRLKYEKGSQTFNNCKADANNEDLFRVATSIAGLRSDGDVGITKIIEEDLINE